MRQYSAAINACSSVLQWRPLAVDSTWGDGSYRATYSCWNWGSFIVGLLHYTTDEKQVQSF